MTGAPAQPIAEIPGQTYGVGPAQQALQEAMPTPQVQAGPPPAGAAPAAQPAPAPSAAPVDPAALVAAMRGQAGLLLPETTRPNEPVTHGINSGPGAGREVLGMMPGSPVGETMRSLAQITGDPFFAELARKANL